MGMFSNIKSSMAMARTAMQQFEEQAKQAAANASNMAPSSTSSAGFSMSAGDQPGQFPPGQFPPGQFPPGQFPPGQFPPGPFGQPGQYPPGQFPPNQFGQPGQFPPSPTGRPGYTPINFDGMASSYDDFQPARSKRRPMLMALSLLCLIGGGALLTYGIVKVVQEATEIRSDAVAEGSVALPGEDPTVVPFVSNKAQAYSIYVDIDTSSENVRDRVVADTTCVAQFADGDTATMRGSRQGTSNNLGDLSSIGYFDAPEGQVYVICQQSSASRPDNDLTFYVTPGTTNVFGAIGFILGGAGLLAVSLVCAIFGFRRKYQTTTIAA